MPSIRTNIKVTQKVRLQILANVVYELVEATGYKANDLRELIQKGIIDEQALQSLEVAFIAKDGEIVASVEFCFNWGSGSLTVNGTDERLVDRLNLKRPITDQVATVLKEAIEEASCVASKVRQFKYRSLYCQYVNDLERRTGKSRAQWNNILGLSSLSETDAEHYAKFKRISIADDSVGGMLTVGIKLNKAYFS